MKTGTLIRLLTSELKERNIVRNNLADALSYTPTYLNRMLRGEKMSTLLFEEIMEGSGITLQDLANRYSSEVLKEEDFGPRWCHYPTGTGEDPAGTKQSEV